MHNSEIITKFSSTFSNLVGVFKSLDYSADLKSVSLFNEALCKVSPIMKESWMKHMVKINVCLPNWEHFNVWLSENIDLQDPAYKRS